MTDEVKHTFPEIPWAKIENMRHRLVYEYHHANLKIVWDIAKNRVPEFEKSLDVIASFINSKKDRGMGLGFSRQTSSFKNQKSDRMMGLANEYVMN
ncbi:MAG: DUF86 domain-containing protein [Flavobacteriaceae bacterium]|nr:DUF86 domain-containing protein [Flavobacteriaceae bacterium]